MGRPPKAVPPRRVNPLTTIKPVRNPKSTAHQAAQAAAKSRKLCPNKTCTSPTIEDGICKSCGTICEESNIVSEVQFGENAAGGAVLQGTFVSADEGTAKNIQADFRRVGGVDDREKTLREGKRLMQGFGNQHRISESIINSGVQIFKLACMNNFIQGRRLNMVAAVCLYTACRKEKPCRVMLIDFADFCSVNVFKLGHCFTDLHKKVTLSRAGIEPVLPEDLIYRFASKLEFGQETSAVAETAIRLVKRMAKDWIVMGRRPSGICGACLIMAARMHNFRRTTKEVVYIVKVTTRTIQKRLDEFKFTPSSDLTIEEFLSNQFLESAHDPPSFYQKSEVFQSQKKTRKRKRSLQLGEDEEDGEPRGQNEEEGASQVEDSVAPDPEALPQNEYLRDKEGFVIPPPPKPKRIPIDPSLLTGSGDQALDALAAEHGDEDCDYDLDDSEEYLNRQVGIDPDPEVEAAAIEEEVQQMLNGQGPEDEADAVEGSVPEIFNDPTTAEHAKAFATAEQRVLVKIMIQNSLHPPKDVPMTTSIDESEFADDVEVSNCLLSADEAAIKEKIWLNANKDWVEAQQEKEFKKRLEQMGPPKATRKRVKKPRIGEGQARAASTPTEAAIDFVKNRSWSRRINYDAIKGLFEVPESASGSAATSKLASRAGSTVESSLAAESVESVAGESEAGQSIADEIAADESAADESAADESAAGETGVDETGVGEIGAGESDVSDSDGSESEASESVAGNMWDEGDLGDMLSGRDDYHDHWRRDYDEDD